MTSIIVSPAIRQNGFLYVALPCSSADLFISDATPLISNAGDEMPFKGLIMPFEKKARYTLYIKDKILRYNSTFIAGFSTEKLHSAV